MEYEDKPRTFSEAFKGKRAALIKSMRVTCRLRNILRDNGLLTGNDVEEILDCCTEDERVGKLICILERRDNALLTDFIDALVEDEQEHVVIDHLLTSISSTQLSRTWRTIKRELDERLAKLIKSHDVLSSSFVNISHCGQVLRPLKQEVQAVVGRLHIRDISSGLQTDNEGRRRVLRDSYSTLSQKLNAHRVADAMFLDEDLTPEEHSAIKARTQRKTAAKSLLDILLKDTYCTKFDSFLQALISTDQKQIYVDVVMEALVSGCNIGARHRRQIEEFRVELVHSVDKRYSSIADLLYDSESWLSHTEHESLTAIIEHWNSVRDVLIASLQPANTTNSQPTRTQTSDNWVYSIFGHWLL